MEALFRPMAKVHFEVVKPYLAVEGVQGYKASLLEALKIAEFYEPYMAQVQANVFLLGFFTFLTTNTQPKRSHVLRAKDDFKDQFAPMVYAKFKLKSMVADRELAYFNKRDNGVPDAILFHYYGDKVLPVVRGFGKKGFLKDAKDAAYFKNLYYAGGMLAVTHDIESGARFR